MALLAQSTYGGGGKGAGRKAGFRGVKPTPGSLVEKLPERVSLQEFNKATSGPVYNISDNPHRQELARMEKKPELIDKDREHYEQTQFFAEVYDKYPQYYPLLSATPNGGFRKKAERWRLCAQGQKAGWPDTQLMLPRHGFSGLFIEFKKPFDSYRSLSEARRAPKLHQINTLRMLNGAGYIGRIAFGAVEAMKIFEAYLVGRVNEVVLFFPADNLKPPIEGECIEINQIAFELLDQED